MVERLDRLLPQTQCGQCGYNGCRPYAEAMAAGEAGPARSPPGGAAAASALALLLGVAPLGSDRSRGDPTTAPVAVVVAAASSTATEDIRKRWVRVVMGFFRTSVLAERLPPVPGVWQHPVDGMDVL